MKKYLFVISLLVLSINSLYSQDDFFGSSTTIGGYGELHYNKITTEQNTKNTLDFHRFVMFYGHQWNEKWSFKAEIELEHNFVADDHGELELEQAYVDTHMQEAIYMPYLSESIHQSQQITTAHVHTHWGEATCMQYLSKSILRV